MIVHLPMKDTLARNIQNLHGRIADACEEHDRDTDDISVVAVTKTHPISTIKTAVALGLHNIGESKIQEAEDKIAELGQIARFHMVGHLQTNKAKKAVELFDVIQSIDSLHLAEEVNKQCAQKGTRVECLVQVNCSGESQKFGVLPDNCLELVRGVSQLEHIDLTGLMTIGPLTDEANEIRSAFALCHDLFRRCRDLKKSDFDVLSMGMTDDFELAIAEGSTMIRVGSLIFGTRPNPTNSTAE